MSQARRGSSWCTKQQVQTALRQETVSRTTGHLQVQHGQPTSKAEPQSCRQDRAWSLADQGRQ